MGPPHSRWAQVAGYAVSARVGNTAVIVKLFRVLLLFPVLVSIAWWFLRPNPPLSRAEIIDTRIRPLRGQQRAVGNSGDSEPVSAVVDCAGQVSASGLLIAISALGLGTSVSAMAALGLRHVPTVMGTTILIIGVVTTGMMIIG